MNTSSEGRALEVSAVLPVRAGSLVVSGGLAITLPFWRVIGTALQFSTDLAYGFDLAICAILIFGTYLQKAVAFCNQTFEYLVSFDHFLSLPLSIEHEDFCPDHPFDLDIGGAYYGCLA